MEEEEITEQSPLTQHLIVDSSPGYSSLNALQNENDESYQTTRSLPSLGTLALSSNLSPAHASILDYVDEREKERESEVRRNGEGEGETSARSEAASDESPLWDDALAKWYRREILRSKTEDVRFIWYMSLVLSVVSVKEHSENVKRLYKKDDEPPPPSSDLCGSFSKILWTVIWGWWLAGAYFLAGALLFITFVGIPYANQCFLMGRYVFWPFGKFVSLDLYKHREDINDPNVVSQPPHLDGAKKKAGYVLYLIIMSIFVVPFEALTIVLTWMPVVFIPMAKNQMDMLHTIYRPPLSIAITDEMPTRGQILFVTFQASNRYYYKYSVLGMNVILCNLFPFVLLALFFAYVVQYLIPVLYPPDMVMFAICLVSVIPLAYYIGMALSSLSAQTSFTVGAVLNASFGSIIELILYFVSLRSGLVSLVQSSVTGTLLGMMLLLPGLSMVIGGIKYPEMVFNPASAGVSSVLLILSMVGAFTPTLFYQVYGHHILNCENCVSTPGNASANCTECIWGDPLTLSSDPVYTDNARPLSYCVAVILPVSYIVGLIFTLKTHAHIIDDPDYVDSAAAAQHGPNGAKWKIWQCIIVLCVMTILFALIAEELVETLQPTLDAVGISETFAGLTIIALIPNTAEFVNAIQFALHNNFSMSLEIANSAAVQVALIQMPVLVAMSAFFMLFPDSEGAKTPFTLIFPTLDLVAVFFGVIVLNYLSINGKTNYFEGASLLLIYTLLAASFFWIPSGEGS